LLQSAWKAKEPNPNRRGARNRNEKEKEEKKRKKRKKKGGGRKKERIKDERNAIDAIRLQPSSQPSSQLPSQPLARGLEYWKIRYAFSSMSAGSTFPLVGI